MADDIIIRKAKKDYVCMCCGHIIPKSSEYLDRIVFVYGKPVRHDRYHDECPRISDVERLFKKIAASDGDLIAADVNGDKIHIIGIKYISTGPRFICRPWDKQLTGDFDIDYLKDYHDEKGDPIL